MIRAIFVDLDGTLVDYDAAVRSAVSDFIVTEPAWSEVDPETAAAVWMSLRTRMALDGSEPLDRQRVHRMVALAARLGVDCNEESSVRWSCMLTDHAVRLCRCYSDVSPFLELAGPLGLITNGELAFQTAKLIAAGLDPSRFVPLLASCDFGHAKPSTAIYGAAAEMVGCHPSECAMVGDNHDIDVAGALAAGFGDAVLVDRTDNPKPGSVPSLVNALDRLGPTCPAR